MPNKLTPRDVIKKAQEATRKTEALLEEAHHLHEAAAVAQNRAEQLNVRIRKQRAKAVGVRQKLSRRSSC